MASLILSTAGSAAFGPVGGFLGALAGARIDALAQSALSGPMREPSRLNQLKVQSSTEGAALPIVHGRMRLSGTVIWASRFRESDVRRQSGGKGGARTIEKSYSISFALALCEGPITGIGRVWANGEPLDMSRVNHRVHLGSETENPDPSIEAIEGIGRAPAHRGIAHIVFEDLVLDAYADRIPHLSVEVFGLSGEADGPDLPSLARAVCLIPGAGEFAYATTPVRAVLGEGRERAENQHAEAGRADIEVALDQLARDLPNVDAVSLVVAWFGDDLRAGACSVRPKVEAHGKPTRPRSWSVAGLTRDEAAIVTMSGGSPAYGGSPADFSVIEAIRALKVRGHKVTLNPFVMMDIASGNALPNPSGGTGQPPYPWRGRITCHPAPGQAGSVDHSAAAEAQVAAFFGTASASHFAVSGGSVTYSGPPEWSYRRFVLHLAALAKAAGGVDSFLVGSEMIGLTRVRDAAGGFPAVAALRALAAEVRALLGPLVTIGYGADWTEYGGYSPPGTNDLRFPLDPLWADANIGFVGVDWYAPLADQGPGDPAPKLEDFAAHIEAGEAFDYYYASDAARAARQRSAITDGAYNEPWVWRQKDLRGWWSHAHHERFAGVRQANSTAWTPQSKPIRLMELGCPAVDRGANRPSVFPDPKSVENGLPPFSTGARDDTAQRRALRAVMDWWRPDNGRNPVSSVYGGNMIDTGRTHLWCWDARPWPAFPGRRDVWADGDNAERGHWLMGRTCVASLPALITDLCARAGITQVDAGAVEGTLDGFSVETPRSARSALEPLLAAYGIGAAPASTGAIRFWSEGLQPVGLALGYSDLGLDEAAADPIRRTRKAGSPPGLARVSAYAPERDLQPASFVARGPGDEGRAVDIALPATIGADWRAAIARRAMKARNPESAEVRLSPAASLRLEPGDAISLPDGSTWSVLRLDGDWSQNATLAARGPAAPMAADGGTGGEDESPGPGPPTTPGPPPPGPVIIPRPWFAVLDLPQPWTRADRPGPTLAVAADPWVGPHVVRAAGGAVRVGIVRAAATTGLMRDALPEGPAGRLVPLTPEVDLSFGALDGGPGQAALMLGDATLDIIAWRSASLTAPGRWRLHGLVRGLDGAASAMAIAAGATLVLLDAAVVQGDLPAAFLGAAFDWTCALDGLPEDDPGQATRILACHGVAALPWPPCHLRARRVVDGIAITWIRRSRGDGDSWAAAQPPSEVLPERYRLELAAPQNPKRSWEVSTPGIVYASADEAFDFPGPATVLDLRVAQLSANGEPGRWLQRLVTVTG